ncbi:hypothetical protein ACFWIJ_38550, partial [Streptomyces sp. NPDC127079]
CVCLGLVYLPPALFRVALRDVGSHLPAADRVLAAPGLTERLEKAGGTLEAGRTKHGFRLVARVPLPSGVAVGSGA